MAKHGEKKHIKRLAVSKRVPITDRKHHTWILKPRPGAHPKRSAMALGVLLRDVFHFAKTLHDVKRIINAGDVLVNGKVIKDEKSAIGFMDVVEFPKISKKYVVVIDIHNRLSPIEVGKSNMGYGRVVRKYTLKGNVPVIMLHNGRNILNVPDAKVGDTIAYQFKDNKLVSIVHLNEKTTCLITDGKHAGRLVVLNKIVSTGENNRKEVYLKDIKSGEELITVFDYLMAVDDSLKSEIEKSVVTK